MCRLFGFRSIMPSMVHRSLVAADNALCAQSQQHPDGWGLAYYIDRAPHVVKSAQSAVNDHLFHKLSGVVSSETVLAHVRKATVGSLSVFNSHPFQHGRWVFAHNGTVPAFEEIRARLLQEIDSDLRPFILGETDSEVVFYLFMSRLRRSGALGEGLSAERVAEALRDAVQVVRAIADARPGRDRAALTLMTTDGAVLLATRGGRQLFWSQHKSRCADRATCSRFVPACEAPSTTGKVSHLIISSEPLGTENVWLEVPDGQVVGVDGEMRLFDRPLEPRPTLRVAG